MNKMKEQILAILKGGIKPDCNLSKIHIYNNTIVDNRTDEMKAAEIDAHVKEFIEWFMWQDEIGCEGCGKNSNDELIFFDDDGTERSIENVYQYWIKNIKK